MRNRPDFIDSAEYRRHALLNSRQDREIKKDEVKIRFLEENAKISRNKGWYYDIGQSRSFIFIF